MVPHSCPVVFYKNIQEDFHVFVVTLLEVCAQECDFYCSVCNCNWDGSAEQSAGMLGVPFLHSRGL